MENYDKKQLLVYLYTLFNGDNKKIMDELVHNEIKASHKTVSEGLQGINVNDYVVFWEDKSMCDGAEVILCREK